MKLHPAIAPYKVAVLPLTKKQSEKAEEVYATLAKHFSVEFDVAGQIGKRYRRQDAIGTPYCVTVDFDTMLLLFVIEIQWNKYVYQLIN